MAYCMKVGRRLGEESPRGLREGKPPAGRALESPAHVRRPFPVAEPINRLDTLAAVLSGRSVLAIEPEPLDRALLDRILVPAGWELRIAGTLSEAADSLARRFVPVVLVPAELFDDARVSLPARSAATKLVATVRFADYYHAARELEGRAYDILAKPFASHEVLQVTNFAWASLLTEADPNGWT